MAIGDAVADCVKFASVERTGDLLDTLCTCQNEISRQLDEATDILERFAQCLAQAKQMGAEVPNEVPDVNSAAFQ